MMNLQKLKCPKRRDARVQTVDTDVMEKLHKKGRWCFADTPLPAPAARGAFHVLGIYGEETSDLKDEEYMLAQLTDEHEPDDGWSNVRSRRRKKITKKGITDEMPELNAVHDVNDEKITGTSDSGAAVSAMPKDMVPNVPQSETCENKFYRVANRSKIKGLGGKKVTFKTKNVSTQSMSFRVVDVTKALSSVSKICQRKNRVVFDRDGSYIKNKTSGKRLPMRVESGDCVVDVHIKDLIGTEASDF